MYSLKFTSVVPQPPESAPRKYLRRYTHLPAVMHMLQKRAITLLDPSTWDDKNDSFYLNEYKRRKDLKTVLAACLSGADETYHHWKIFAGHASGVCVRFRQGMLLDALRGESGITAGLVEYRRIKEARNVPLPLAEYPFVKRASYADEKEVRVIYESATGHHDYKDVEVPLGCISRVTLSPWLPKGLVASTKERIRSIRGCTHVEVYHSSMISNEAWKNIARLAPQD